MRSSFASFDSLAEPTGSEEDWRYVDFDLAFANLSPVAEPGTPMAPGRFVSALSELAGRAQIVDGSVVAVEGPLVSRLSDRSADDWTMSVESDRNKLAAAHAAFAHDGVFINIPAGKVVEAPILVEIQAITPGGATFPHLSVVVGDNAQASVVVVYRSAPDTQLLMVPDIDLNIGQGGVLKYLAVQNLDQQGYTVAHQRARLGRDASLRLGEAGLGARVGRLDLILEMEGDGSSAETVGLYFGENQQTLDYRMLIRHSGRNTSSDVLLKGAVEDDAQSVFTGLIRIEPDAVRTSTFETNRNLVLSENAKAHSVPNLEILCDDVICGHGSSVGPLEEEHLYYLQSRGLSRSRAESLLIKGFFQEVIDRLPIGGLEAPLAEAVFDRFVAAKAEGRVA